MEKYIYVFGHQNPDTDSICSSIAYAHLKKSLGEKNVIPVRLGKINKETQYALNYFNVEPPIKMDHIKPQVLDMNYYPVHSIYTVDSVKKAWDAMATSEKPMIPILYPNHRLAGVVTISDIAKAYIALTENTVLKDKKTPFVNITAVLEGRIIQGDYPDPYVKGDVYTTATIDKDTKLTKNDIVLTGSSETLIQIAIDTGAGCIIITGVDMDTPDVVIPKNTKCAIMFTECPFFKAVKIISQSIPVENLITNKDVVKFELDEVIDEVKQVMLNSPHRHFPILNKKGQVEGMISKRHILDIKKKRVILVDHNEQSQSALGIEEAEILEVIDHHRIANVDTQIPIHLRAEPVGCAATIIGKIYEEKNVMPPKEIAGLMLSAIISDTLLFKSPTCTSQDRRMAKRLAKIADVNINKYGMDLIAAGTSVKGLSARELLNIDRKVFAINGINIAVSQVNTSDFKTIFDMKDDIKKEMEEDIKKDSLSLAIFMITDLVLGGSEIIAYGDNMPVIERAFNLSQGENSIFLPNVYSRKKQIVPQITKSMQSI
ncbi:pyrophosphatase [Candidatus Epulonipiscium fishelsonii]|uniref:Pyrophosphatase n=1 Tax=Candidatus Epulonipiscium fishelsonii TaxID=77094 RepID=A0ACC8XHE6_9FIRM|nr:pyrophosphatase [Epulopiscium sp. SCG-B05WGA-EpuloA1]ONI43011.1 pyrophosphatase [Epulopiscium sp. SCG-B11WGA-EpuloA1]